MALEEGGMLVEAEARDRKEANDAVLRFAADIIVLSAALPGGAVGATEDIARSHPATEIVLYAPSATDEFMLRVVAAGAHGFLLGSTDPRRLPHTVAGVLQGEAAFPRRFVRVMADELARRHRPLRRVPPGAGLTAREEEVHGLLEAGLSREAISVRLGISAATVRSHATRAERKLHAPPRIPASGAGT
ncbi:response regulator transcription factor [Paraconexibacter antarcticus]|uniref:Response regulator transcription factor n=1 Tax=Paraconexibacter antarcticus TaxID=2949664 RepID=A0ABY5E1T3_9ACTN|nr:response regulator transcription factor [Paraconexibacter antarcticus]